MINFRVYIDVKIGPNEVFEGEQHLRQGREDTKQSGTSQGYTSGRFEYAEVLNVRLWRRAGVSLLPLGPFTRDLETREFKAR